MSPKPPAKSIPQEFELVTRAKKGDKEAYRILVEGHQDRVFGLVVSMTRNAQTAEDLTQEIFVKAYFALSSFQGGSAFYTWLFRIASNHCLDHLRKHRPVEIPLDATSDADDRRPLENTFEAPQSEQPESPLESEGEISQLLLSLDPEHRLVLTLREVQGYAYEEMANMLNCPINTIKSRLNRAREALKAAYERKFRNILQLENVQKGGEKSP